MAKNDRFLLDGIVDDRVATRLPSDKRDEAFEYLAFEQVLKDYDLSNNELLSGWIDGRQDGGIDGFFVLVNGHLLQDPEAFIWPRTGSDLRVFLISCKHHETFKQGTLDAIVATLTELLDFGIEDAKLQGAYSEALLRKRNNLRYAYRKLSPRLSSFSIDISYASRGDTLDIGTEVRSRADQLKALVKDYFGSCQSSFTFVGCSELVELHRKIPNFTLELPFVEALAKGERYVVLVRLSDYFKFVSDDDGKLRRYLFESNVRDFMGLNRVNEDIRSTLENKESPDFWWLNNGVTILATSASITGKSIQATEIQIVNGLQTTESIYRYLSSSGSTTDDRCVLVKVIVTKDEAVRDEIIRATNNQTDVELASLHATDKIQRDIEDALSRSGLFYERRKNYYVNLGHAPAEIITPLYAAAGYIALVLKMPERAASLRSKFMRSSTSYETVFSSKVPLEVWPKIAHILKLIDAQLETLRPRGKGTEKFLKGWRYMIALFLVSKSFGKFTFSATDLIKYDTSLINATSVREIWYELNQTVPWDRIGGAWTRPKNVVAACTKFAAARGISGSEMFLARSLSLIETPIPRKPSTPITDDFLDRLKAVIPPQPWKPGLHRTLSRELGCDVSTYFSAVERLIEEGVFYHQKDGVLYDGDGNVVSFDPDRVDPKTLALISDVQPINPPDATR